MRDKERAPVEYQAYKKMVQDAWHECKSMPVMPSLIHPDWLKSFDNFYRDMGPCPPGAALQKFIPTTRWQKGNARWVT